LNEEMARQKSMFENDEVRRKAQLMTRPIDSRNAFGYFGLMIGSLPAFAIALKILSVGSSNVAGMAILFTAVGIGSGLAGFGLGRRCVPGVLRRISNFSLPNRAALLIVMGVVWGALSGAVGGLVFILVGSIPGAILGGMVGAVVVPIMVGLHSCLRAGDFVEMKHFLPVAFGITLSVCAFVLGL
jgi:hypothetical protein